MSMPRRDLERIVKIPLNLRDWYVVDFKYGNVVGGPFTTLVEAENLKNAYPKGDEFTVVLAA